VRTSRLTSTSNTTAILAASCDLSGCMLHDVLLALFEDCTSAEFCEILATSTKSRVA